MRRASLIVVGWLAVCLGVIGIFLPLLPTTSFLLLAAWCFARSSDRFYSWLLNSPMFGSIIRDWQEKRCIESGVKRRALVAAAVTFAISIYIIDAPVIRYLLLAVMIICLFGISRIPTVPRVTESK